MKLLWTVSNWKRTGPVEPSLDLAAAMAERGHDVTVAVGRAPDQTGEGAREAARARGLALIDAGARLSKHRFVLRDVMDVRRLRDWVRKAEPDAIVTTLRNDHRLMMRAAARVGTPVVARLWFGDAESPLDRSETDALRRTDIVTVLGAEPRRRLLDVGVPASAILSVHPPLDVAGFETLAAEGGDARQRLGIPPGRFVFGIVARMQTHRRFELLWDAVSLLKQSGPPFHVVVVGRGTNQEIVARRPVADLGLDDVVTFAGYLREAEYASTVAAFDAQLLLVPGSDPTCRALREGMALGVPSLATRRGLLPEIVVDGRTGLLVDEEPDDLLAAMARLAGDREGARQMGAAAAARAAEHYAATGVAAHLEASIQALLTRDSV